MSTSIIQLLISHANKSFPSKDMEIEKIPNIRDNAAR